MSAATAAIVAGAQNASRRRVARRFRDAGALGPETAIAFSPEHRIDLRSFDRLVGDGALKSAGGNRFWLDEAALAAADQRHRARASRAVLVFVSILAIAVVVGLLVTNHRI